MKVALALQHGHIPAHLNCEQLNPLLEPLADRFVVPRQGRAWPRVDERRRVAGVTSMGLSGTNVHVIVEEAPVEDASGDADEAEPQVMCVSARTAEALLPRERGTPRLP